MGAPRGSACSTSAPFDTSSPYQTTYAYDALGNLTSTTDALGHVTKTTYADGEQNWFAPTGSRKDA